MIDDELEVLVREARDRFDPTPTFELAAARLALPPAGLVTRSSRSTG